MKRPEKHECRVEDRENPEDPAPSYRTDEDTTQNGPDCWAEEGEKGGECEGVAALFGAPAVCWDGCSDLERQSTSILSSK